MAKIKYDGVVEAVRYANTGEVEWVRAYLRRGPTFSDHVILPRQTLVKLLKAGKRIETGQRIEFMASTFKTSHPIRLVQHNGKEILVAGKPAASQDTLEGVPIL